jgi:uncharacterized protein (DUF58 family)
VGGQFIFFLLVLLAIAAVLKGDFAFTILYLIVGTCLLAPLWNRYAIRKLRIQRTFEPHAFLGEYLPVRLQIQNTGILPIVWLRIRESIPTALATFPKLEEVLSLPPKGQAELVYKLHARKRGRYAIGPFFASSNDVLGLSGGYQIEGAPGYLTVYPYIIPLFNVKFPSRSPLGTLRHHQPIFEDPSRVLSKRDYIAGDSMRRVDWKASAVVGRLQVKQFEPSIALETTIFLNLNRNEYPDQARIDSTELAIVIAASLANWIISKKQSVGLVTNGGDPLAADTLVQPISSRKGRGHLMNILEILARVQLSERMAFTELVRNRSAHLPWGTTLVLIAGQADESLFDELFQAQRRGQDVVLVIAGRGGNLQATRRHAHYFSIPFFAFRNEAEVNDWRKLE